ncbi:MAG: histidine phosphatase family protein [Bacteriovorax sp.]|nr:histidine phosphatase family protein [Bacteriovorax sp.]
MKMIIPLFTIFLGQSFYSLAYSAPAQVVIIRHGEKPAVGNELNTQGWQRANALPQFFENNKIVAEFGKPIALYAGAPNKPGGAIRSIQTITPYADQLGLIIHKEITKNEISSLVNKVMNTREYEGRTVIICWEHSLIPEMAQLFGETNAPTSWDDNVFDRAWVIRFKDNQVTDFLNLPQHLLPSDSAE